MSTGNTGRPLKRATTHTIKDKFMVGYQGWFTCAGDGRPIDPHHHGWLHWITHPLDAGGRPNTDLWPDLSAYDEDELYPVPGLCMQSGEQARLFSSRHPKTVRRHFHWMAEHGVDGVFLQRFLGQCDVERGNQGIRDQRDEIGRCVREAAEAEGRVFAIMYDVSGVPVDRVETVLRQDWMHLVHNQRVLDSPNYLKEDGRPVIALWGFGFSDREYTIHQVRGIISFVRAQTPGGAYIIAGVPAHWRTSTSDAVPDPDFVHLWLNEVDVISPWTIGRYCDESGADDYGEEKIKGDLEAIKKQNEENERVGNPGKKLEYMPVVFPGGSGFNLSEGKWGFNDIKRNGGRFFWRQIWNARRQGVRIMYGAMWDEYDEGTALLPVVSHKRLLPRTDKWPFLSLDEEGHDLPPDWYMRIAGFAAEGLRSERMVHESFPVKELQDYWSTRPRYEEPVESARGSGSTSESQAFQRWEESQGKPATEEPPPPPYSLEADVGAPAPTLPQSTRQQPSDPVAGLSQTFAATTLNSASNQETSAPWSSHTDRPPLKWAPSSEPPVGPVPDARTSLAASTSGSGNVSSSASHHLQGQQQSIHATTSPGGYRPISFDDGAYLTATSSIPPNLPQRPMQLPNHPSSFKPPGPASPGPASPGPTSPGPASPYPQVPYQSPGGSPHQGYPSPQMGYLAPSTQGYARPGPYGTSAPPMPGFPTAPYGTNSTGYPSVPSPSSQPYNVTTPYPSTQYPSPHSPPVPGQGFAATTYAPPHTAHSQPNISQQYSPPQPYHAPSANSLYPATPQAHSPYGGTPDAQYSVPGPPPPPRPTPQSSGSWSSSPYAGVNAASGSSGMGGPPLVGQALNTVERFTSRRTRQELERGVNDVMQMSSKFMSRFTK